jgi:hypothetical protein
MKYLILILLICNISFADEYIVKKGGGKVAKVVYVQGSQDSFQDVLKEVGLKEKKIFKKSEKVNASDIDYWTVDDDGVVTVDNEKKLDDISKREQAKLAEELKKQQVDDKLAEFDVRLTALESKNG